MALFYSLSRCGLLVVALTFVAGCGDEDPGSTPAPPTAPTPPPPSGVAVISGNWTGASSFQQNGIFYNSNTTATLTQNDRAIAGTIRFTSSGWESWRADVSGTVAGTSPDTQFVGTITVQSNSTTGTGICTGNVVMAGRSIANSMRWEAQQLTLSSNVPTQPASACMGTVFTPVLTFTR
jgi:hypothetical protein